MKYFLLHISICLGFLTTISAQETPLNKQEAIRIALKNNFGIQIAKKQLSIADNNQGILNSGYLPSLSANASATYNRDDSTIEFPGQFTEDGAARGDAIIDNAESRRYNSALNLNYTLFDGLGRLYNYKRLKEQYQLSELQVRETIENTILQLFSVYFQAARLTENEKVLKQVLEVSKQRVTRSDYAFEYGQNSKLAVLNAKVDATNDSIALLNTQLQVANVKRDLNVVLNQELNTKFTVDTIVNFIPEIQLTELISEAKNNNVALLQTQRNKQINAYDIKVNQSGYLPKLDLRFGYGWNLNQSARSAFFPGVDTKNTNFIAGANFTWNLFDGGSTSVRVKNAKINYESQELLQKQVEVQVMRDILNAQETYKNRLTIFQIQEQNVATNQNNFERSKEQFQLGRISSIEFRQAQINLLNAQTNKNLAKYDAKLAELQLLQLTGQLLNVDY